MGIHVSGAGYRENTITATYYLVTVRDKVERRHILNAFERALEDLPRSLGPLMDNGVGDFKLNMTGYRVREGSERRVADLIAALQTLPQDAQVHADIEVVERT